MGLTKYKLGDLIELCDARNSDLQYSVDSVKGISIQKVFIETKADMKDVPLRPYKLVKPNDFAYVTVTSRNGEKITIAHNTTKDTYIVSSSYIVFRVKKEKLLLPDFLFMYFNRPEFDRYSRFNSWGSARETFSWEDFCDIDMKLPPLSVQQKYVAMYQALLANQKSYEQGLEDLKLVCDGYIDGLKKKAPKKRLGDYITLCDSTNEDLTYGLDAVRGISIEKKFISTKANMEGVSLKSYAVVKPNEFAYVTVTSRNGEKISLARNASEESYLCSGTYVVFKVNDEHILLPAYLSMLFERNEFNRYSRFHSWGSARETFDWEEMQDVVIPVPSIETQESIVNIFRVYNQRKQISEKLKSQLKAICPILIKGALEEGAARESSEELGVRS